MAKILVVDDEITMIQITSELLRAEGHEVFSCSNLENALAVLETQKPELVITDLYLEKGRPIGLTLLAKANVSQPAPRRHRHHWICHSRDRGGRHAQRGIRIPPEAFQAG